MPESEIMFTNCEYDYRNNKIHLWEIVDGIKTHHTIPYEHDYYQSDPNGTFVDMYGNKMVKKTVARKKYAMENIKTLPESTKFAEADISETTKFLHNRYNFVNLKPNPDYVNTMSFDIEVEVGSSLFPSNHKLKIQRDEKIFDIQLSQFESMSESNRNGFTVFDETTSQWVDYTRSCYNGTMEFPKPSEVKVAVNAITAYFSRSNRLLVLTYNDRGKTYNDRLTKDQIYEETKGYRDKSGNRVYKGVKLDRFDVYEYTNELSLLESFVKICRKESIDVITGWSIEDFDIPYVINRMIVLGSDKWKQLSPINKVEADKFGHYNIKGISVLDYIKVYRDRFTFDNKGSYSLNNICGIELKKSKMEFEGTLSQLWKEDWDNLINYNIIDTLRVVELERKMKFINLIIIMTHESLIQYVGILGTLQDHLGLLLRFLAKQNTVLNNRETNIDETFPGAYVYAAPGKYKYVISFDVTSLYPTIIIRDNVGQETLIQDPETEIYVEIIKDGQRFMIRGTVDMNVIRDDVEIRIPAVEILESDIIRI